MGSSIKGGSGKHREIVKLNEYGDEDDGSVGATDYEKDSVSKDDV